MLRMQSEIISGLYVIIDGRFTRGRGCLKTAEAAIRGGARVIQLREKELPFAEALGLALEMRKLTQERGVAFIVNDDARLALECGADGLHLGQEDMPLADARALLGGGRMIGISTHSLEEALAAQDGGTDYIGFGPMYRTSTKDSGLPKGPEGLAAIRDRINIPIAAIGGINAGNAGDIIRAGADALAVVTAVTGADDMAAAAAEISSVFRSTGGPNV